MDKKIYQSAFSLLEQLIETPSFSGKEEQTAEKIGKWLSEKNVIWQRTQNNVWAINKYFSDAKPTILLNSHHDTVKPNSGYTHDPFKAIVKGDKLYGLGSNDAGGALVSLLSVFSYFYDRKDLKYNLIVAATAEEENSGPNGLNSLLSILPTINFALVGEPTEMNLAIAEKGLLVIDAYAHGIAGHAAHENTKNPIYQAIQDIQWIKSYEFLKTSKLLGKVKMSVTQIQAGEQHNLVPTQCHFVIDIRINDMYANQEVFETVDKHTKSELNPRSLNLNASSIATDHCIVQSGISLGRKTYGSPTLSDQAVLNCPSLKIGPGLSSRSHSANEYIFLNEIKEGILLYKQMLEKIL